MRNYIYPANMNRRALFCVWTLPACIVIVLAGAAAIFFCVVVRAILPIVCVAIFALLSAQIREETSILSFLGFLISYFFYDPQLWEWSEEDTYE